jgi:5-formyltetrahydrofolate cyclo-ligase
MDSYPVNSDKQSLRAHYREIRSHISNKDTALASENIKNQLLYFISENYKTPIVIAGYLPINHELDILPLLEALHTKNHICVMPKIIPNKPLEFKKWQAQDKTELNNNIPEPLETAQTLIPNIIITPLLACDKSGNRLGYGKGLYDITIAHYRNLNPSLLVIGLCYHQQISETDLPIEAHDQKLDLIITDQ